VSRDDTLATPKHPPGGSPDGLPTVYSPLERVVRRAPVTVPLECSVIDAVRMMAAEEVSSIVVVDPANGAPLGIFTLRDLMRRVVLAPGGLDQPIAAVMTAGLVTLPATATAHQAATLLERRRLHHVVVTDDRGRLVGVVTQTDLIGLSRLGAGELSRDIGEAATTEAIATAQADVRRLTQHLIEQNVGADTLTQLVASLNDLITSRIIELTLDEIELPAVNWCWIALGSEGRLEQTLATDQDNGIVFESDAAAAAPLRQALLPFARKVNERLAACGFPLCKGEIMAGNPQWCLSLHEWMERFRQWIEQPQPEALLNASIFFDLRPLYGETQLAERLREWLLRSTRSNPLFLRMMAQNALRCQPPLGVLRDFRFDKADQYPHTIDLKMYGGLPFVDAARILALANGVPHTNTAQRLRVVAAGARFGGDDAQAMVDAFWFVQSVRLRNQHAVERSGVGAANRVDPDRLNELDRYILKAAFRQARKLQQHIRADYQL